MAAGAHRGQLRVDRAADAARGRASWSAGTLRPPPGFAAALALAVGGVAVAFGLVAFTPAPDPGPRVLPVAVVITVAARLAAFAALRGGGAQSALGASSCSLSAQGDAPD